MDFIKDSRCGDYVIDLSLLFVLLSLCVDMLLLAMKISVLYRGFFSAIPHLSVFVQLKSVCLAFRSPVMTILSAAFLMLTSSVVVLIEDAGGI